MTRVTVTQSFIITDGSNTIGLRVGAVGTSCQKMGASWIVFKKEDVVDVETGNPPSTDQHIERCKLLRVFGDHIKVEEIMDMPVENTTPQVEKKDMTERKITTEKWREYSWIDPATGKRVEYRIINPESVYFYKGCTTHRVVDVQGVAHCVPAPGYYGCVIRWQSKDGLKPVSW